MSLSKIISEVGDEHVLVQCLTDAWKNAKTNRKGITTITFQTDAVTLSDLLFGSKIGLVIWIPKERLPKPDQQSLTKTEPKQ